MASVSDVLGFVWSLGTRVRALFVVGCIAGVGNGMVYPILAYLFASSFSKIAGAQTNGLEQVRNLAYTFMIVGIYAFSMACIQTGCLEICAHRATKSFRLQWFQSLLRQDAAFFDVHDIGGLASTIGPNSGRFRRGIGRKLGEGLQFFTTGVGGIVFAFYQSWSVALVILGILPLVSLAALSVLKINQTKGARESRAYSKAGSVAYSTVSAIKTVLSLNAIPEMIRQYKDATLEAFNFAVGPLWSQGFAFGSMLGTFIILYCILALFGTYLLWSDVQDSGCDPSEAVDNNATCSNTGTQVFGAMLGVAFASQGVSQVGNFVETFTAARVAAYPALQAIHRKPGAPAEEIYETQEESADSSKSADQSMNKSTKSTVKEEGERKLKAILPAYNIDAFSDEGLKPTNIKGNISFKDVVFTYPTRPDNRVLKGLNLEIEAGKTVALVGPSGGGKSTTVALLERFYDPLSGSIELDGINLKDINVHHLRSLIGYVGQEPVLFATSIAANIKYGNPSATQEQIEAAAKMANAHDFISSFPDGYATQCGDKGSQMSGGQKQRIAIARVLVSNPEILLLDEATSALDSESELVVQDALDNVVAKQKRTTIVIAHRLSTIRNADTIAVISGGVVAEQGTHDELMALERGHYRTLVEKQERPGAVSESLTRNSSMFDATKLVGVSNEEMFSTIVDGNINFEFKDVKFAYPTRPRKNVLNGFNLAITRGETVALVGPSGGGKSTIVAMIERFYDCKEGSIEYMGNDIKSLNVHWYRDQIGYVGQEPTLFNTTIGQNIAYGAPGATQNDIEAAAVQANAHDFIMGFPDGYETSVGERGTQLSGGQKQRVAIARALIKKPKVLILDEATSALDTESEAIVQEALDKLMASSEHTTIVIAHRLSTIRNVDRIAFIAGGKVLEYGSHDVLMANSHGRYKRLVDAQSRGANTENQFFKKRMDEKSTEDGDNTENPDFEAELEVLEHKAFSLARAREMSKPDVTFMLFGAIGAIMAGGVFPSWGVLFAETIHLLFRPVNDCTPEFLAANNAFEGCQEYWQYIAHDMRHQSFELAGYWLVVAFGSIFGNMLTVWGFGMASERLNKRVRDSAFAALIRQEVGYFDKRSVGSITSQLQDDAARIHTFSGEPIRSFLIAISAVITGIVVSFIFMWPFALVALACIPFMGFATSVRMKTMLGENDTSGNSNQDELNSSGGIVVETLLNVRTVSALTLEKSRFQNYEEALNNEEPNYIRDGFIAGSTGGLSMFIQQWVNALQMWWGGYVLYNYQGFSFNDFLISMFALLFSLFGLGSAFQGLTDKNDAMASAGRIFYLLDRKSEIDPLSEEGKKLD